MCRFLFVDCRIFCVWTVRIFCLWTVRIFGTLLAPLGAGASSEVSFGEAKWFEGPTNTQNSQASEFEIRMTQTKNRESNRKVIRSENYITVVRFYMAMCHHKLAFQIWRALSFEVRGTPQIYYNIPNRIFLLQTVNFGSFGCSPSTSSDFAEIPQNHAKKLDLAERIRMHRSRASGASNLSRYGRFCTLWFVRA